MPRPKPLVSLHGAVNFDKLVPFDAAPNSPPLAANDILVFRKAAGGDNLTISIGDITATGAVNIAQLLGGANDDMLFRVGGVWTGSGPTGLSYDGTMLTLDGDSVVITDGGNLSIEDAGSIEIIGSGNLEQSGTGNIEISGGGSLMVSADGNIEIEGANAQIILSSGAEMTFEGGAGIEFQVGSGILFDGDGGILFDGDGGIVLDGSGDIELDSGQILANLGTAALPGYAFAGDPDTGVFGFGGNALLFAAAGVAQFAVTPGSLSGVVANAPILRNAPTSSTAPNIITSSSDSNTGIGSAGADILSHIAGGVEGFRVAEVGGVITNTIFGDLIAAGGGGAGPMLRNTSASPSVPTIIPNQADPDTGLTRDNLNGCALVGGGLACIRARNIGGAEAVGFYTTNAIIKQTGVAVTAAAIHTACVNLGLFSA